VPIDKVTQVIGRELVGEVVGDSPRDAPDIPGERANVHAGGTDVK